jgi:hypothetical protein
MTIKDNEREKRLERERLARGLVKCVSKKGNVYWTEGPERAKARVATHIATVQRESEAHEARVLSEAGEIAERQARKKKAH